MEWNLVSQLVGSRSANLQSSKTLLLFSNTESALLCFIDFSFAIVHLLPMARCQPALSQEADSNSNFLLTIV